MSEQPGRGYLPPTVPAPGAHRRWPSTIVQQPFNHNPHNPHSWQPQTKYFIGSGSPQSEVFDLSSTRPESAHNGGEPINGQIKEAGGVSVIAPNPLIQPEEIKEEEPTAIGSKAPFDRPIALDYLPIDKKMPPYSLEYKGHPAHPLPSKSQEVGIPSPLESKGIPAESKGTPSDPVESKVPFQEKPDESPRQPCTPPPQPVAESEVLEASQPPEADHVESLLQNMFQGEETTPIKQSVIVTNSTRAPLLTEDKVVAILEDKNEPTTPVAASSPLEAKLSEPHPPPTTPKEEPKMEDEPVVKQESTPEPDKKSKFMEVESELEKMFAGIVESADESKPQPQPKSEPKKKRKPVKPRQRKSTDSVEKKGKKRKREKPEDVKEGKMTKAKKLKITKEGSNDSSMVLSKTRGPYIHLEGSKEAPTYVGVVNSWGREEEERERTDKALGRRKQHSFVEGRIKGSGLYISTLSAKYNAQSADTSWVCIFCKLRPHCENGLGGEPAGDLFGPYILTIPKSEDPYEGKVPGDKEVAAEQKRKGGGKQLSLRAAGVADQFIKDFSKKAKKNSSTIEDLSGEREVWVHEMCAVWAPGVLLVGAHLIGLGDAISSSSVTKCSNCGGFGASIGCVIRNCSGRSHYSCAVQAKWDLDFDNFIATCPTHTQKKLKLLGVRSA